MSILKVKKEIFILLFSGMFVPDALMAQKIEIGEKGVSINSTLISNESTVRKALGLPGKTVVFPDSIKGGYWEYPEIGLTVYFTEKLNLKTCDLSITCKSFTGELFFGKSKLNRETHIYKLLQFGELKFKPIDIEPIPENPNGFMQLVDAICFGKNARIIYDRPDNIGLISIDIY
jgi:hypothetical protein